MNYWRAGGIKTVGKLTDIIDNSILNTFKTVINSLIPDHNQQQAGIAAVAIGGYGRRELTAYSDVDLMILSENRDEYSGKIAEALFYYLWDIGMNISHSFRTLEECLEDAMKDITIRTSLMESRFIAGDKALFEKYRTDIYQKIVFRNKNSFISEIMQEADKRHKKSGGSAYLLEPDIKEGKGSLRDIHTVRWLAKAAFRIGEKEDLSRILTKKDYIHLLKAHDFLLRTRLCLHSISKRRNDILSFELHETVAEMMSLKSTKRHHAAEILLRLYYKKADFVFQALSRVMHLCRATYINIEPDFSVKKLSSNFSLSKNEIIVRNHEILKNTDNILEAFYHYSITGKSFSHQLKSAIINKAIFIDRKKPLSKNAINFFMKVLEGSRVYDTLRQMHDTGVLDRFIPEFGSLRHLVIYEPYHKYTVDEHTLISIKNLETLKNTKNEKMQYFKDIFKSIEHDVLFFALLLHDIGKGIKPSINKRHEETGYKAIKNILERFGLPVSHRHRIEFLVKNHSILSKLALTRDSDAPETIMNLCEIVENEENLKYLFIMTYADMTAVNPHFWTEWKAYLFYALMKKANNHMRGILQKKFNISVPEINRFLESMPERYLISNTFDEIKSDSAMAMQIKDKKVSFFIKERVDGTAEIIIATSDMLGLFARIVRVLSSSGLNILRARLYTSKEGFVIDKILISNWRDLWWEGFEDELKDYLRRGIFEDLKGQAKYEDLCSKTNAAKSSNPVMRFRRFEHFIEIENETSPWLSILEITSPDRLGLLYEISSQLYRNNVDIISAIINTEDGVAQDVFYLQCEGTKLNAETTLKVLNSIYSVIYSCG